MQAWERIRLAGDLLGIDPNNESPFTLFSARSRAMRKLTLTALAVAGFIGNGAAQNWPQGSGSNANFVIPDAEAPTEWSVVTGRNIAWRLTLPETGQSTVTAWGNRLFFTFLKPVEKDSELGQNLIACCSETRNGDVVWTREIKGEHPLRLSGCFSDSSAPPAVTDGKRVVFFNASGTIACFDFEGNELWSVERLVVGRTQPFLRDGLVHYIRQIYPPDGKGHFTHEHKNAPLDQWTQLQALDIQTGKVKWTTTCGVNMGSVPLPQKLADGKDVIFVGRGGGHSPPEKPEGVSMIDANDGKTLWTLPLPGFMATQTISVHGKHALIYHGPELLKVDATTGKIDGRISIVENIPTRLHTEDGWKTENVSIKPGKNQREITQQSNLLVGDYAYFRCYQRNYLGRVNVTTDKVEFLQLPTQLIRERGKADILHWTAEGSIAPWGKKKPKGALKVNYWALKHNDMKNSRGFTVVGDARSQGNGWGHIASQLPTAIGKILYVPIMNGAVFAIDWNAPKLDETALVSINDLGPAGEAWNRASLSFSDGRLYAHTIKGIICIE
jgi:outer membrane protein assembly factor BamB